MLVFLRNHLVVALSLLVGALALQAPAYADTFAGVNPVSSQKLAQIRGGFSVQFEFNQMRIALETMRLNFINGNVVSAQHETGVSGGTLDVIQSGLNNTVSPSLANSLASGALGTVIQNSLNDQVIHSVNVVNLTVTSQAFAQAIALQSMFQSALLRSVR